MEEGPFFTCLNLLVTTGDLAELRRRVRMFIVESYGDSLSCQLCLPLRRESCLGIFLPGFNELLIILTYLF